MLSITGNTRQICNQTRKQKIDLLSPQETRGLTIIRSTLHMFGFLFVEWKSIWSDKRLKME